MGRGLESVLSSPAGFRAESRPNTNLMHFKHHNTFGGGRLIQRFRESFGRRFMGTQAN